MSDSSFYLLSVSYDTEDGPFHFKCVGASIENAIASLQELDIIRARWIANRSLLPSGFYDIVLENSTFDDKAQIAPAFYDWVNQHFPLRLEEELVNMEALILAFPQNSKLIRKSDLLESEHRTESVGGAFGVAFKGITIEEFSYWLREKLQKPVVYTGDDLSRYDFFLPCFPHPQFTDTILEGLKDLGMTLSPGVADIYSVTVKLDVDQALR